MYLLQTVCEQRSWNCNVQNKKIDICLLLSDFERDESSWRECSALARQLAETECVLKLIHIGNVCICTSHFSIVHFFVFDFIEYNICVGHNSWVAFRKTVTKVEGGERLPFAILFLIHVSAPRPMISRSSRIDSPLWLSRTLFVSFRALWSPSAAFWWNGKKIFLIFVGKIT